MSRSKTEYLKVGGADVREELKLQGDVVKRAKNSNTLIQQLVAMEDMIRINPSFFRFFADCILFAVFYLPKANCY